MLALRKEQVNALSTASLNAFVKKMVSHHIKLFLEWSKSLGEGGVEKFVHHGIARAKQYGFESELEIARYLHVMQALGGRFDESSEYPWAAGLLKQTLSAQEKMNRLRDAAHYELEARRIRASRR